MRRIYFVIKNIFRRPFDLVKKNNIDYTARISNNVKISKSSIGRYSYIASNVNIINSKIGNYCSIAPGVQIGGMEHSHWWYSMSTFLSDYCISNKKTYVGNDVWIAAGAIIRQGVNIGDGAVVGAMSFVNSDVPANTIVFGNPAKFYRKRLDEELFAEIQDTKYWNMEPSDAKVILSKIKQ